MKLFFLLALSALTAAYWFGWKRARSAYSTAQPYLVQETGRKWHAVVAGLLTVLVLGSGLWGYWKWQDGQQVLLVHVVDIRTGSTTSYQAKKKEIFFRSFISTEGRQVTLSDLERLEVESATVTR